MKADFDPIAAKLQREEEERNPPKCPCCGQPHRYKVNASIDRKTVWFCGSNCRALYTAPDRGGRT